MISIIRLLHLFLPFLISSITASPTQWTASHLYADADPPEGTTETTKTTLSVLYKESKYHLVEGKKDASDPFVVGTGSFTDSIGSAGWGALEIETFSHHADERQSRYTNLFPSVIPYCNSHNQRHVLTIHCFLFVKLQFDIIFQFFSLSL